MDVNALLNLLKTHSPVVNDRLVHVTAIMVPETPVFLLTLINEVADVIVSAISQTSQNAQLSFCSRILFISASISAGLCFLTLLLVDLPSELGAFLLFPPVTKTTRYNEKSHCHHVSIKNCVLPSPLTQESRVP